MNIENFVNPRKMFFWRFFWFFYNATSRIAQRRVVCRIDQHHITRIAETGRLAITKFWIWESTHAKISCYLNETWGFQIQQICRRIMVFSAVMMPVYVIFFQSDLYTSCWICTKLIKFKEIYPSKRQLSIQNVNWQLNFLKLVQFYRR